MSISNFVGISGAAVLFLSSTTSFAAVQGLQPTPDSGVSSPAANAQASESANLLKQLARQNDMTMAFAEMGARKAQNADLKRHSLQLQEQQKQLNAQLEPVVRQHGLTLNQTLTSTDQDELSALKQQFGQEFDSTLAKYLLRQQQQSIWQLRAAARSSDPALANYANQALPQVQQQLEKTQTLAADVHMNQPNSGSLGSTNEARGGSEAPK